MRDFLLILSTLAVFVYGDFIMRKLGRFMEKNQMRSGFAEELESSCKDGRNNECR